MNDILDHDEASLSRADRELTLGTGTILGIFLALIVLCGACFGGGYVMGHKSQPASLTLADTSSEAGSGTAKPAAGSPADSSNTSTPLPSMNTMAGVTVAPASATPVPRPIPVVVRRPPPPPSGDDTADASESGSASAKIAGSPKAPPTKTVTPGALLPSAGSAAAPGFIMVQVAAVSHQEDADLLIGALRGRGYAVMARKGTGDPLIHVQVGPFSNKPAAEAMRQKLMGDGYNAMLKY